MRYMYICYVYVNILVVDMSFVSTLLNVQVKGELCHIRLVEPSSQFVCLLEE